LAELLSSVGKECIDKAQDSLKSEFIITHSAIRILLNVMKTSTLIHLFLQNQSFCH